MSESDSTQAKRTPWHLWVIGIIALLWNVIGAMDYVMTETKNASYMSNFTPEQIAYFYGFPAWVVAAWAVGVWGGVLGSVLLLLRRRLAVWVYLVSIIGLIVTAFYNFVLTDGMRLMGGAFAVVFSALIFLIAIALYLYSRAMTKRGVLV